MFELIRSSSVYTFFFLSLNLFASHSGYREAINRILKEKYQEKQYEQIKKNIDEFISSSPTIAASESLDTVINQINKYIFITKQIASDNSYESRENKDNILPNNVIDNKRGHCLGLSALFLLIAEKNKVNAALVRGPDHVFVKVCTDNNTDKICKNVELLQLGTVQSDEYYRKNLFIDDEAIKTGLYLKALDNPDELAASIYLGLGFISAKQDKPGDAEKYYQKAIQYSPKFPDAYNNLAAIKAANGNISDAKILLNKSLALNKRQYATLLNSAIIELKEGHEKKFIELVVASIKANPLSIQSYNKRAQYYLGKKKDKQALLDMQKILVIQPAFCDVLLNTIELKEKLKLKQDKNHITSLKNLKESNQCKFLN